MTELTPELIGTIAPRRALPNQWIESAFYDLAFFILAPLLGIAVVLIAPTGKSQFIFLIGAFVGIPHYLSTFNFYSWSENRAYHRTRWIAFYAGPIAIAAVFALMMATGYWDVLKFVLYFWNAFHIARQSCGILSIYRHRSGETDASQKNASNAAILTANACCAVWSVHLNPNVYPFLQRVSSEFQRDLRFLFLGASIVAMCWFVFKSVQRLRDGRAASATELAFFAASIVMFVPYLWIDDWNRAIFGVLVGHFVQYLALVWLINRRRAHATTLTSERLVFAIATRPVVFAAFVAVAGVVFTAGPFVFKWMSLPMVWEWIGGVLVTLHFYLDGLFWAFQQPHVRATIAPLVARRAAD